MTALTIEEAFGKVDALIGALTRVADNQDKLIAGQAAALAKIDEGKGSATTRKPRASKTEEAPAAAAAAEEAPAAGFLPSVKVGDTDAFKGVIQPWLSEAPKGTPEANERLSFLRALADHLGVEPKGFFGPVSADADKLKEALFLFLRKKGGHDVTFGADYDLDGDPAQDAPAAAADDDSDFG